MRGRASRPDLHGGAVILIGWRATATMVAPESPPIAATPPSGSAQAAVLDRESGLRRNLTPRQLSMIALGGAIGTGLFLGSAISVRVAGSFGVYAEMYLHPWAGFVMRYSYWLAQVVAIGSEVVAAAIYCRYWFP